MSLLSYVEAHKVDKVLIYECSRLSRRAIDFLTVIEHLSSLKVSVYILQNGLETLMEDGSVNPIASLVLGIIGQFNSMERSLIRSRMESGYKHYRQQGGQVGRKVGYKKSDDDMRQQYSKEIQLLRKGLSLRNIQAITSTSVNTLRKLKAIAMS
jgi:DNA invertase Pin-like site-specific DNA recombinase